MKIRPKIPIFLLGNIIQAPQWYIERYGGRTALLGWNKNKRYDNANQSLMLNDHLNAGDLNTVYTKNKFYTDNPIVVTLDILSFYDSDGKEMSAKDFENYYNSQADIIRGHWAKDLTYNKNTAKIHNPLYRRMFMSRSNPDLTKGSDYNIGYQENLQDIEGSSTWLRRMDLYENDDLNDPDRIHEIILKDGTKARYYKEKNGNIRLLENPSPNNPPSEDNPTQLEDPNKEKVNELETGHKKGGYGFDWNKVTQGLLQMLPGMLEAGRLAGSLYSNAKIYDAKLKGIRPNLVQPYSTHRQVVGDEATKLAYYRRGAQGMTRAALPFTSDADRQMAYMMEAKRANDELLALGDIADNLEIRRTSDESNLHLWANTERYTRAANENIALLNYANAAKLDLIAQQHAANWSSWDNYLKSKEYRLRQRQAEALALDDEIFALLENYELLNDLEVNDAYQKLLNVIKAHTKEDGSIDDINADDIIAAKKVYQQAQINTAIRSRNRKRLYMSNRYISLAASGTKITRKRKDDLLYKSAKDVVEHFRKMSKMSDDSTQRSRPKRIFKLNSHPGKTRRMQLGGVAPFTVFTPVALGGETSTLVSSTGASTGSKKSSDSEGKETLDLIKSLFQKIEGLPIDVNTVYKLMSNFFNKARIFGNDLSTNDIASMYLQSMLQLSNLKYSQNVYNKAEAVATSNDSLSEFAVTAGGLYVVIDDEGNISYEKTWKDVLESGKNPVTNLQLLNLRAYSPKLAFGNGDALILNIVNNGMGINKIGALIKALAGDLGESDTKIEGLTQVESGKVKSGLLILANAPDGYYKYTKTNKNQQEQVNAALKYIENMLSPSQKAILETHGGTRPNIMHFLSSQTDTTEELTISPLTGKASDKDGKDSSEKIKSNPLMQLILGEGGVPRTWNLITKDSNVKMSVDGIEYSQLPKITEDMSLDKMLSESGIAGILDSKLGITFGDLNISPDLLKDIMYSNSGGMVVTLPCKIVNGHKEVNLGVKKTYEEAIQEVESKGISKNSSEYYKILGEVLKQKGLNSLLDSNGYPDKNKFGQFLVVEAYTTDKIKNLDTSSQYIEKVKNPDALLEERMIKALSTDSKKSNYNLDIDYWLFGDDVYRGTVFIPLNNNLNAANNAWGSLISVENARELENKFQNFNKASNMKSSNSDVL